MPAAACSTGRCPSAWSARAAPQQPDAKVFEEFAAGSGKQSVSTTMVFARLLRNLVRDPTVGSLVAPIVSDEARTFGLEPLIAEAKIYAPDGQNYVPVDADLPLNYAESTSGQVLQEGITEAGALASFTALATAYATWGQPMVPVFLFYSMFGFQRVGDLAWALGDMRGRGILAGCTAGRTTLQGRGAAARRRAVARCWPPPTRPPWSTTPPSPTRWPPSWRRPSPRCSGPDPKDRFWYLTLYNETYPMPPLPEGDEGAAIRAGHHRRARTASPPRRGPGRPAGLRCASPGPMWSVAMEAQRILAERYGVGADAWAVTSWTSLRADALEAERWNRLHPDAEPRRALVTEALGSGPDPVVAITDYMRGVPDQVARFVDRPYASLGTDGFGRSDARGRPALVLRGRRRPPRGRRAAAARARRTRRARRRGRGDRRPRHRPPGECRPVHGLSRATKVASASSAPSGTRRVSVRRSGPSSMATSKKAQHCFSR